MQENIEKSTNLPDLVKQFGRLVKEPAVFLCTGVLV